MTIRVQRSCILSKFYIKPQHSRVPKNNAAGCILSKFYIKPQLAQVNKYADRGCILSKFYIKPQPLSLIHSEMICCILSKFYIKPQPAISFAATDSRCILSKFYIKPQLRPRAGVSGPRCILSKFYIKPQHAADNNMNLCVVSYRNSTSNHNLSIGSMDIGQVVSYRNSTSNHNNAFAIVSVTPLYLIEILHQTTTKRHAQTCTICCILSKFYIKPQHSCCCFRFFGVVSYRNSTSNHNRECAIVSVTPLYLIEILHQTTTGQLNPLYTPSLYLIEILHQTTTRSCSEAMELELYLIEILHQTTTYIQYELILSSCILSKFYIKPQLLR